jgi:hypothetical protein
MLSGVADPELEARVAALEARLGGLSEETRAAREDAAAARHLAAASDRDVADILGELGDVRTELGDVRTELGEFRHATTASFNAMRDDMIDLRIETRSGFAEVRGKLDGTAAGVEQITGLLNQLIGEQGGSEG